jgi:hypothetical protein
MPAKSKQQLKFMAGVMSGSIKAKGLSKTEAAEWVHSTKNAKSLPNRVKKHK